MLVARIATVTGADNTTGLALTTTCNAATSDTTTYAVVVVNMSVSTNSASTSCTVTYGGTSMTQQNLTLVGSSTSRAAIGIYTLNNPATGSQNVVVTPGGSSTKAAVAVGGGVYSGVASLGSVATAASTSLTVTSQARGYVVAGCSNGATLSAPNQNSLYLAGNSVGGVGDWLSVQDAAGAASISFTNSGTATTPESVGIPLVPRTFSEDLQDDFTTKDTTKWTWFGTSSVVSGQLNLVPTSAFGNVIEGAIQYNMSKSYVQAELISPPNVGNGSTLTYLIVDTDAGGTEANGLLFSWNNNVLSMIQRVASVDSTTTITYNSTNHKYLRIEAYSGVWSGSVSNQVFWMTSPDGLVWTTQRQITLSGSLSLTACWLKVSSGYSGTEPSPGTAIWDNFNILPAAPKTATLTDDFNGASPDTTKWTPLGPTLPFLSGGQLVETVNSTGCDMISVSLLDLTSSFVAVELVSPPLQGPTENNFAGIYARIDQSFEHHILTMELSNNLIYLREWIDGTDNNTTVAYSSTAHKYFRIRESGGTIYWDTSPDGTVWTNQRSKVPTFTPNSVTVQVSTGLFGTGTSGTQVTWDNFNVLPGNFFVMFR